MDERELDALLESAIAGYGEMPANDGLERRILAQVQERSRWDRRLKVLGMAACVVMVLASGLFWRTAEREVGRGRPVPVAVVAPQVVVRVPVVKVMEPVRLRKVRKARRLPKLAQFPAPQPSRNEGQAYLLMAAYSGPSGVERPSIFDKPTQPIQMTEIRIRPVEQDEQ